MFSKENVFFCQRRCFLVPGIDEHIPAHLLVATAAIVVDQRKTTYFCLCLILDHKLLNLTCLHGWVVGGGPDICEILKIKRD